MAIRLISQDEKFTAEIAGCRFYYRRLPQDEARRIREKFTVRGKVNTDKVAEAALAYCLLGWDGVEDAAGEPAPFSTEAAGFLPPRVFEKLQETIMGTLAGEEAFDSSPI